MSSPLFFSKMLWQYKYIKRGSKYVHFDSFLAVKKAKKLGSGNHETHTPFKIKCVLNTLGLLFKQTIIKNFTVSENPLIVLAYSFLGVQ